MTNAEVMRSLRELALYLEMDGVPFKPRAYERAAYAVTALDRPLAEIIAAGGVKALLELPGVGKGIASRIAELVIDGRCRDLEEYRRRVPADIVGLTSLEGLGPKRVKALWNGLGVESIEDLEAALIQGKLRELPGFGDTSEARLLEAIGAYKRYAGRWPIGRVLFLARSIEERLRRAPGVERASIAGSLRRFRTTIGDLDFLAVTDDPRAVMELFATMPEVAQVYAKGPTKTLVRLEQGIDADLRVVPKQSFGAALQYFTGSKAHNIALRKIAIAKGLKLSEYGLFLEKELVAGASEAEVYSTLGLPYIPPELREDEGELEAAIEDRLPRLIEPGTLRGDLQLHTSWTDGRGSIEEVALAARRMGLEYIAITDHTRDLAMTGGLDEDGLRRQARLVRAVSRRTRGIRVLAGAEVNIRRDGTLDIADEVLAELDVVGAAVHSHFTLPREEATRRIIRAMENPNVDIIFHLSGRQLGRRQPMDLDIDAILDAALRTGTILELDAQAERLDLDPRHVRKAVERGVKLVIDSDAHDFNEMRFTGEYGIGLARRGWAEEQDVINTLPLRDFLRHLKGRPKRARRVEHRPEAR